MRHISSPASRLPAGSGCPTRFSRQGAGGRIGEVRGRGRPFRAESPASPASQAGCNLHQPMACFRSGHSYHPSQIQGTAARPAQVWPSLPCRRQTDRYQFGRKKFLMSSQQSARPCNRPYISLHSESILIKLTPKQSPLGAGSATVLRDNNYCDNKFPYLEHAMHVHYCFLHSDKGESVSVCGSSLAYRRSIVLTQGQWRLPSLAQQKVSLAGAELPHGPGTASSTSSSDSD